VVSVDDGRARVTRSVAAARAAGLLLLVGVVYGAFVLTGAGRQIDIGAFVLVARVSGSIGVVANEIRVASPFVLAVPVVVLGAVALVRRRWQIVLRAGLLIVAALAAAELLKPTLPRPWDSDTFSIVGNSFPSGHVAVTLALALVTVILSPTDRWHTRLALATGVAVVAVALCSVISSAHRPSDVIGAALLVGFLVQVVFWRTPAMVDSRPGFSVVLACIAGAGVVAIVTCAIIGAAGDPVGALTIGIPGLLLLCIAPCAYALMLAPTGPLPILGSRRRAETCTVGLSTHEREPHVR
jgi:membrane-associated phospholipid phosphatase